MMNCWLFVLALLNYASLSFSCAPHCTKGMVFQEFEGINVAADSLGPVDGERLNCGFNEGEQCCWRNEKSAEHRDDFLHVINPGDLYKVCKPAIADAPTGGVMGLWTQDTVTYKPVQGETLFVSCPVSCSIPGSKTEVSLKAWKSPYPKIEVCRRDIKLDGEYGRLQECQLYKTITGTVVGTPTETFTFTATELYQIVIVAKGFISPLDYVGFDDIKVKTTECTTTPLPSTTTETMTSSSSTMYSTRGTDSEHTTAYTQHTTGDPYVEEHEPNICHRMPCSFEPDMCKWRQGAKESAEFKTYPPSTNVGNIDTGVNAYSKFNPNAGMPKVATTPFVAANLRPRSKAVMELQYLDIPYDVEMRFKAYEACRSNNIRICFDVSRSCRNVTNYDVTTADRQWIETDIIVVPAGTRTIKIIAQNDGNLQCAAGVMDFIARDPRTGAVC